MNRFGLWSSVLELWALSFGFGLGLYECVNTRSVVA